MSSSVIPNEVVTDEVITDEVITDVIGTGCLRPQRRLGASSSLKTVSTEEAEQEGTGGSRSFKPL